MALVPTNSEQSAVSVTADDGTVENVASSAKSLTFWEQLKNFGWRGWLLVAVLVALYAPVLLRLVRQWYTDPDYSHGFLVPFLSAYLIWQRRDKLAKSTRPSTGA